MRKRTGEALRNAVQRSGNDVRSEIGAASGVSRTTAAIATRFSRIASNAGITAAVNRSKMNVFVAMQ